MPLPIHDTTTLLSYGMGVESTAILLRWIFDPPTCPCELKDLIVITSQVGNEFPDTGDLVAKHILPLLREHHIRFVQVARHGPIEADGITVLSDSHAPQKVYIDGDYKLSDELRINGTVVQVGGVHHCAQKFKGFVIERWLSQNLITPLAHAIGYNNDETGRIATSEFAFQSRDRATQARVAFGFNSDEVGRIDRANEYDGIRNAPSPEPAPTTAIAFGFNSEEETRIERNREYSTFTRLAFYPLLDWGWNRQQCLDYIQETLGVTWRKSACIFCPFACNRQNKPELLARHAEHPNEVADAMLLERTALSLNPRATMYISTSLLKLTTDAGNTAAVTAFEKQLAAQDWALYRVRRIYHASKKDPSKKGITNRAVERLSIAEAGPTNLLLDQIAEQFQAPIEEHRGIPYVYLERRGAEYPAREEYYSIAPAVVPTKARNGIPRFDAKWAQRSLF